MLNLAEPDERLSEATFIWEDCVKSSSNKVAISPFKHQIRIGVFGVVEASC
jgi:hypothetical protein